MNDMPTEESDLKFQTSHSCACQLARASFVGPRDEFIEPRGAGASLGCSLAMVARLPVPME